MDPYVVEVECSTHDALQQGVTALPRVPGGPDFTTVVISPHEVTSDTEACLLAAQIAACTSRGMPTATRLISFPI